MYINIIFTQFGSPHPYNPSTVFLAYQCLLVQIHPPLPINGKNNDCTLRLIQWKVKSLQSPSLTIELCAQGQNSQCSYESCNQHVITSSCNLIYLCRYSMLQSHTDQMYFHLRSLACHTPCCKLSQMRTFEWGWEQAPEYFAIIRIGPVKCRETTFS